MTAEAGLAVLIHGAYTHPWHWHRLVPLLEERGWGVIAPELPCDDAAAGIEDYVAAVEDAVGDRGRAPLVVGSSLGAVTAAVYAARHPARALVTVCGIVPRPRHAVAEDAGAMTQPEFADAIEPGPDGSTRFLPEAAREIVFHESENGLALEASGRLRLQAARPLLEPCPFDAYPDIPRVGVVSSGDRLIRPDWLERAVRERMGVEPVDLGGDHAPMLSQPDRLAEVLLGAA